MRASAKVRKPLSPVPDRQVVLRVALPLPLPRLFDYRLLAGDNATERARVGCRVRVPFGQGERIGVVVEQVQASDPGVVLKPVTEVLDATPVFDATLWRMLKWASAYYHYPLGEVLHAALPATLRRGDAPPDDREPGLALTSAGRQALSVEQVRAGPGLDVLKTLLAGPLPVAVLRTQGGDSAIAASRRLRRRGWIETVQLEPSLRPALCLTGPPLTDEQQAAIDAIAMDQPGYRAIALEGVTGSGKTEVYLHLIERVLAAGRQALVLVPEIALTPQALRRYRERLPAPVLALHSGLSDGERARAWTWARSGRPCVLLGTRSAVFSPVPNVGLIVVDEEHDASYKQGEGLRYHARDLALVRAKQHEVPIVLGSATPSLELLALVADARAHRLHLSQRAAARSRSPQLRLVDVRRQALVGGLGSEALHAVQATLERGEQALVFRNRRGYAPLLTCSACGWHSECPRCDRAMTVHRELAMLLCHHCGLRRQLPVACPSCAHTPLDARGIGTERIELELRQRFPDREVLRIDRDSARTASRLDALFDQVAEGGPAILVGTQLLAKGHDWPALTLVVVVDADHGLFSPDFRAPERLAQLLTQVAGRAGRGERPGRVLIQTRQPDHPFWPRWLHGGHAAVAVAELAERRESALPPFRHQALLAAEAREHAALDAFFQAALALPEADGGEVERSGPMPAPMPRRAGHHRAHLLLEAHARAPLHALLSAWLPKLYGLAPARRVRWSLDVDPYDLY